MFTPLNLVLKGNGSAVARVHAARAILRGEA